jgi:hypothetical protein
MNRRTKLAVAAATVVLTVASTVAVAAEGGVPEALNRINGTLNALIATVNRLATSVDLLVASSGTSGSSAVLISPAFSVRPSSVILGAPNVGCSLTNVGSTPVNFRFVVIDGGTGLSLGGAPVISDVAGPGQSRQLTRSSSDIRTVYCRFEADAPPAQLRAQIVIYTNGDAVAAADAR